VLLATAFNGSYALLASSLRHLLLRGRALPFVRRYVSGTVFVSLGVLAARAGQNSA
jgi:threonine/homoserine/homoserine lactone efflux protein